MKFPDIAKEPILLGTGEVLEGEIRSVKQSRRTTTHTETVSKKSHHKDGAAANTKD